MTGFDLWATHPGVPGAAHYDLSHSAVEHAVATVLLVWNGAVTTADFDGDPRPRARLTRDPARPRGRLLARIGPRREQVALDARMTEP